MINSRHGANQLQTRIQARWAAVAFGLGLGLAATPARANSMDMSGLGELAALFMLGLLVCFLVPLVIFVSAAVLGRRAAPMTSTRRVLGILGIVASSLVAFVNLIGALGSLYFASMFASRSERPLVLGLVLFVNLVPLALSTCAIVWSARLYGRNRFA